MLKERYIGYVRDVRKYSSRTVEIYGAVLDEYFTFQGSPDPGDDAAGELLTPARVRNYEVYLLEERGVGARTVGLHLSVLSGLCRHLVRDGLLRTNPVKLVGRPKQKKRLPQVVRQEALDSYMDSTREVAGRENLALITGSDKASVEAYEGFLGRMVISLLSASGIRRSELISLTRSSFDPARRVLHVRGKGDKMREIPLIPSVCDEILLYLEARSLMTGERCGPADPLLVTPRGGKLYPVAVDRIVKKELSGAGVTGRKSPHVLRHTLATGLLDEGADLNSIKELLGHSSLAATQVYTHNTVEKLKNVYNNAHPRAKRGGKNGD